jgi:predicted nucleotidyltransferase
MTLAELRQSKREQILRTAGDYGARNVRVFGSVARGSSSPESDIDFLVDLDSGRTLMDLGGLLMRLQEIVQTRVDIATEELRPELRERVLRDATPL